MDVKWGPCLTPSQLGTTCLLWTHCLIHGNLDSTWLCHSRWAAQILVNPRLQISTTASLCRSSHFSVVKSTDLSQSQNFKNRHGHEKKKKKARVCQTEMQLHLCTSSTTHTALELNVFKFQYINFIRCSCCIYHNMNRKRILYSIIQFEFSYRSYQGSWKCFWRRWRNERLEEKNRRAGADDFHIHPAYRVVIES